MKKSKLGNSLVSIIIPVYNTRHFISNCLDSCIEQSFKDIEIIVVNDGSTDESKIIIENYKKRDSRIKSIDKLNEGVNFARKSGIDAAKGKYLFFLDSDDTITENCIEYLYESILINDADIAVGNIVLYKNDCFVMERKYSRLGNSNGIKFLEFILHNRLHYLWGKLIRRELYYEHEIILIKELAEGEDQFQLYQLCMYAKKVTSVNKVVYNYLLNDKSVTQRKTDNRIVTSRREIYSHALFSLTQRFEYNELIRQQINLRILEALFEGYVKSFGFVENKIQSRILFFKVLKNSIFTRKNIVLKILFIDKLVRPIYYHIFFRK
ncbi:MAG: hypothetical protein RIQ61_1458 [Bacteroidota bacterium]|jgi:glycosyltransferase involved in cell wall biosynthesis